VAKTDVLMWFHTVAFYGMILCLVVSFVLAFIAVVSRKAAPALARAIAWINFWAVGGYMLSVFTQMYFAGGIDFASLITYQSFLVPLCVAAGLGLFGFILSVIKAPKHVWVSTILFIFAVAFNIVCVYASRYLSFLIADDVYLYGLYAMWSLSALAMLFTSATLAKTKGFGSNLFAVILQLLCAIAALVAYIINMEALDYPLVIVNEIIDFNGTLACVIALGAFAILGLIFSIVRLCVAKKAAVAAYVAEHGMTKEEEKSKDYVDAVPYHATFVRQTAEEAAAEEEVEEEVEEEETPVVAPAPVAAPAPATASAADDKTKINDEFIATLTAEERKQFADIFMLKSKGDFVGIPDYKAGEDNKTFFRKVFVHLGQYRARIPDELLGKIYDYYTDKY
ncbi:MAG: hypothetical protein IJX18_03595, partial [Clostridia bacterium]|nr:hypothetical protein [Clostridia bacterium]